MATVQLRNPTLGREYYDRRKADGDYADPKALLTLVSTGGRMRNQLDLASATRASATTVIVDPALLVGLDDVSRGRHLPDGFTVTMDVRNVTPWTDLAQTIQASAAAAGVKIELLPQPVLDDGEPAGSD